MSVERPPTVTVLLVPTFGVSKVPTAVPVRLTVSPLTMAPLSDAEPDKVAFVVPS